MDISGGGSIASWFKLDPAGFGTFRAFASKGTGSEDLDHNYHMELLDDDTLLCNLGNGSSDDAHQTSFTFTADTNWHHVVCTWGGSRFSIYIDGNFIEGSAQTVTPAGNADRLQIGDWGGGGDNYQGLMDDLRIYNRAITADEIKRLYKMGNTLRQGVTSNTGGIDDGLLARWTFDGNYTSVNASGVTTALDSTPNANSATFSGATAPLIVPAKFGQGLSFDGVDDLVNAGSKASINNIEFGTWTFWAKRNSNTSGTIMYKSDNNTSQGWWIEIDTSQNPDEIGFIEVEGGTNGRRLVSEVKPPGEWFHYASTWIGGSDPTTSMRIFINGQEGTYVHNTTGSGGHDPDGGQTLFIGNTNRASGGPDAQTFDGQIDDVRIYNRLLTPDEIKRLYVMGR